MVKLESTRCKSSTSQSRSGRFRANNCEELTLRGDKEPMKCYRLFFVCFVGWGGGGGECVCVMCVWGGGVNVFVGVGGEYGFFVVFCFVFV